MKITLRSARELSGYNVEEVARHCGVSEDLYNKIESDPGQTQLGLIFKIATFLGISLRVIYPGTEADCIEHNRTKSNSLTTF